jgi:CheY-like chemotaxis protein
VRILLVADHSSVARQVRAAVDGWRSSEVLHVSTPQRAIAVLDEGVDGVPQRFDVVVADNDTHPTGGLALCREVKARGQMGRDVPPVILLIARSQDRWLANWAQADAHVLKPADPFDLREAVEAVAAGLPLPALPGIGADPKPSVLDPVPTRELLEARARGEALVDSERGPDELPVEAGGSTTRGS